MINIELLLSVLIGGLSALLCFVSFLSWYRIRSVKVLLAGCAFLVFTVKSILMMLGIITQDEKAIALDFVILVLLYISIVKR